VETNKMRFWEVQLQDGRKVAVNNRLDCVGDTCPRPQLKLKKNIKGMESGEIVEVLINNPPSLETLPALCPEIGATHLDSLKEPNYGNFISKKTEFPSIRFRFIRTKQESPGPQKNPVARLSEVFQNLKFLFQEAESGARDTPWNSIDAVFFFRFQEENFGQKGGFGFLNE
tara:strand:- start:239 stop:751 length:513 start_codon:yes stop_codon:yes gene_type:complete